MKSFFVGLVLVTLIVAGGCAKIVGPYYLEKGEYEEGLQVLGDRLKENPEDASSAYYVGRYYLGLNQPQKGFSYLEKAVQLAPDNADYVFWTGVAHWAMLDFEAEKAAYERALAIDPDHISANLYLGHGFIDQGLWTEALVQYQKVIKLDKYNPEALYNKALALGKLDRTTEELAAWLQFLEYYPDGTLAMQATERLNLLGDFTYRNFILGQRNVTLRSMTFKPGTDVLDTDSKTSLHVISAMMSTNKSLDIHVVGYVKDNKSLAYKRAAAVRDYIVRSNPRIASKRLPLSWFRTSEIVEVNGKKHSLNDSVQFITVVR